MGKMQENGIIVVVVIIKTVCANVYFDVHKLL